METKAKRSSGNSIVLELGEVLSLTTVIVRSGAIQKVMDTLAELGLLTEVEDQKD